MGCTPNVTVPRPTSLGRRASLWWLGFFAAAVPLLEAQQPIPPPPITHDYTLREWHISDGLPFEEVERVYQDTDGYLWAATTEGLARFDSTYFESCNESLRAAGASVSVQALREVRGLGLLCAPESGGLYVRRGDRWVRLPWAGSRAYNLLFTERDGTLWASGEDHTILRFHHGAATVFAAADYGSIRPNAYFATDGDNRLWVCTGSFLGRYEDGRLVRSGFRFGNTEVRIASSRQGGPWVVTRDRIHKLTGDTPDAGIPVPRLLGGHYIHTLHEDRTGALWIGTRSQGLFVLTHGKLYSVPASSEDVHSLCEDSEGNLWAGTNGGGLDRLRLKNFQLYNKTLGLLDDYSYGVCQDATGDIWFANRDGGVARLHHGNLEVLPTDPRQPLRLANAHSLAPDRQGKIWLTTGQGILKIDPSTTPPSTQPVDGMPVLKQVRASFVAKNGDYWVTIDPSRIGRWAHGQFTSYGPDEGVIGEVRCLTEAPDGHLWIGTAEGKILRFDGQRFAPVGPPPPEPLGPVQAIYFESPDVIWICTARTGLGVIADGKFQLFDTRHGLPDDSLTDLVRDNEGSFWFGSSQGIFSVHADALTELRRGSIARVEPLIVGRDDGITGLLCLGMFKPSTLKDRDGHLWFATRKGVLTFDPAKSVGDVMSPPVRIAEVRFDGRRQVLANPLPISGHVRKIEVRLSVLRFSAPDRVQIKYRLNGFDSDWATAGPDRIVAFPSLPPGEYLLETASSLSNGVWNEHGATLAIVVKPLWWQQPWVQLVAAALFVALVVVVVRLWSHRRLRQRVARLEQESEIERERARIARDIHDDLGASLSRISLLTQSAHPGTGADQPPHLRQIYETVSEITRSMDEIVWAVNPRHDHLDGLASYLVSSAEKLLSSAGLRCRLNLPNELPQAHLSSHLRHNVYLCLRETLNNVLKHAAATEVLIAMAVEGETFVLTVTDNGRGFDPAHPAPGRAGGGNGLGNMQRRMEEVLGRCEIRSRSGEGTTVRFAVPLPRPAAG